MNKVEMAEGKDILIACHCKSSTYWSERNISLHPQMKIKIKSNSSTPGTHANMTNIVGAGAGAGALQQPTDQIVDIENGGFQTVSYLTIDPDCEKQNGQYLSWDDIPENSFDIIWAENCPIYSLFQNLQIRNEQPQAIQDIFIKSQRTLRPGGQLIIPLIEKENDIRHLKKNYNKTKPVEDFIEFQYKNFLKYYSDVYLGSLWKEVQLYTNGSFPLELSSSQFKNNQAVIVLTKHANTGGKRKTYRKPRNNRKSKRKSHRKDPHRKN